MKAVVAGCGRVGSSLALELSDAGWAVTVVDRDEEALGRLGDAWPGRFVSGHALDTSVLERAGAGDADALIAATSGDNNNIVLAQIALGRYRIGAVAARILDPARADVYAGRGFEVISPTKTAVADLADWARDRARELS